ncbi:MAG: peptidoglycan-binding protein [bacterium]
MELADLELEEELESFDTELADIEQSEVNRHSRDYIRWVQRSLNQILGLNLTADGVLGPRTSSAIRSFQQRQGLKVDGIVGPKTEAAIKAYLSGKRVDQGAQQERHILDHFDFNDARLKPAHHNKLIEIARIIIDNQRTSAPIRSVRILGHTDPVGTDDYNLKLGKRRADQVAHHLRATLERMKPGSSRTVILSTETRGEQQPKATPAESRRVEVILPLRPRKKLPDLTAEEEGEFNRLSSMGKIQFMELRTTIETYTGVAQREADRGSRVLLRRGVFRTLPRLLPEIINLTKIMTLPSGWRIETARPLLVGNVLYNLAFPETINQGGYDRLGGKPDPTCFSASTQILLARRFPVTYVRLTIQLATTSRCTFAGGDSVGPLTFLSTSLYKSLDSVLLQTAFDTYFRKKAMTGGVYTPGDELKLHRQVFGLRRPPKFVTYETKEKRVKAFRKAFIEGGGTTRLWEIVNLCTGEPAISCGNHTVAITRISGGRVYFYNPWANEEERNMMFGSAAVSVSGHGERPAESSMIQADFENQLTAVFHN